MAFLLLVAGEVFRVRNYTPARWIGDVPGMERIAAEADVGGKSGRWIAESREWKEHPRREMPLACLVATRRVMYTPVSFPAAGVSDCSRGQ
jgi:hypothetical protein